MTTGNVGRSVLVTGARGYLGGRICRAVSARAGLALVGTSRRRTPPAGWPGGRFVRLDLSAKTALIARTLAGIDTIIHLAAPDRASADANPVGALDVVTRASAALLEAAIATGVRRIIYVSTAHVYGTPLVGRIDERSLPRPASPYAITRRAAEDFVLAAHHAGRIDGIVVRLSNAIGAPAWGDITQWGTVGNDLCRQAITGGILRLASSGEQWRDFIVISDVAAAMLHLIDLPRGQLGDGLFNLGGAMPLRIIDIAESVADRTAALFGRRPAIVRQPGPAVEPVDYRIDKILATGFHPNGNLADELDATLRLSAERFEKSSISAGGQAAIEST